MDALVQKHNATEVRKALENLSKEVDDTYDEVMERIERQNETDKALAKSVLSWVTHACRPLEVDELQHALAVVDGTVLDRENITDIEILTSVCAGLVVVDGSRTILRLVRKSAASRRNQQCCSFSSDYTTQQYFERKRGALFPDAHASIARTCLTYLSFDVFARGHIHGDELQSFRRGHVFLDYSAVHWGYHARGCSENLDSNLLLGYLQDNAKVACASRILLEPRLKHYFRQNPTIATEFLGMHLCAFFGLHHSLQGLRNAGGKPASQDCSGRTPLHWAAENGHDMVVRWLLVQDDVKVNIKDGMNDTPLSDAATKGHDKVVRLLLAWDDIEVNVKDERNRTPLSYAAIEGHGEVVKLLLARDDIDVNVKDELNWTPLSFAAAQGHDEVVKLLLARDDIDVNVKDEWNWTPLSLAAALGHDEVVKLLLARDDIDVNAKDKRNRTPLSNAARKGHDEVVKLLLARDDIDVNAKDKWNRTPLSLLGDWHQRNIILFT
jgi:ankyrin repeat protein